MQFGVKIGMIETDPTTGVKNAKAKSDGFRTWNEADISAFEARHSIGTKERLALALLLYTVQRRGDVIRMGRQHVRDGVITLDTEKTDTRVVLPILPELQATLDAEPTGTSLSSRLPMAVRWQRKASERRSEKRAVQLA